jgi:hypothetical protein
MTETQTICKTCGFVKETPRVPIFITNNVFSFAQYEAYKCEECGHQSDGSTIPVVHNKIQKVAKGLIEQREAIWKFIKAYMYLSNDEQKEICITIPRYIQSKEMRTKTNNDSDVEEPYSWNVVWNEVINDTKLSRTLVLEWYRKQGDKSGI